MTNRINAGNNHGITTITTLPRPWVSHLTVHKNDLVSAMSLNNTQEVVYATSEQLDTALEMLQDVFESNHNYSTITIPGQLVSGALMGAKHYYVKLQAYKFTNTRVPKALVDQALSFYDEYTFQGLNYTTMHSMAA